MNQPIHDTKIRYAVIGCGQISQQSFIPGIERAANSTLAALVTGDMKKAEALEARYSVPVWHYDDLPELLASGEIDAVYLATPNGLHRQYAVPVLEAGLHLLLEKPMATSVEDCEAILQAQRSGGGKLMIAYRLHCEPTTVELVSRCREGDFGTLVGFSSVFGQDVPQSNHRARGGYWSGPVPDLGNYPINAVRHLFGAEPVEVTAVGTRTPGRDFNFDDTVSVVLRFSDGQIADFMVSYASAPVEGMSLFGSKGSVKVDPCYAFGPSAAITYSTLIDGKKEQHTYGPVEQFGGETFYFSECILNDRNPEPDGEEGLRDVRVLVAVEEALRTGTSQSLPPLAARKGIQQDQMVILPPVEQPSENDLIGVMAQAVS